MTLFADSSALVKLYATEVDSKLARNLVQVNTTMISSLAWVEVPAALWRKNRTGDLEVVDVLVLAQWFAADAQGTPTTSPRFTSLAVTPAMPRQAVDLVAKHGLRAYDAVQLASAVAARATVGCDAFLCFDKALRAAAEAEGFDTGVPVHGGTSEQ